MQFPRFTGVTCPSHSPVSSFSCLPSLLCLKLFYIRYFDPKFYRIILFDQRGAGRSLPHACLEVGANRRIEGKSSIISYQVLNHEMVVLVLPPTCMLYWVCICISSSLNCAPALQIANWSSCQKATHNQLIVTHHAPPPPRKTPHGI